MSQEGNPGGGSHTQEAVPIEALMLLAEGRMDRLTPLIKGHETFNWKDFTVRSPLYRFYEKTRLNGALVLPNIQKWWTEQQAKKQRSHAAKFEINVQAPANAPSAPPSVSPEHQAGIDRVTEQNRADISRQRDRYLAKAASTDARALKLTGDIQKIKLETSANFSPFITSAREKKLRAQERLPLVNAEIAAIQGVLRTLEKQEMEQAVFLKNTATPEDYRIQLHDLVQKCTVAHMKEKENLRYAMGVVKTLEARIAQYEKSISAREKKVAVLTGIVPQPKGTAQKLKEMAATVRGTVKDRFAGLKNLPPKNLDKFSPENLIKLAGEKIRDLKFDTITDSQFEKFQELMAAQGFTVPNGTAGNIKGLYPAHPPAGGQREPVTIQFRRRGNELDMKLIKYPIGAGRELRKLLKTQISTLNTGA